jgi:hypothetical protein
LEIIMFRKALFGGLTLMLAAVLVWLIIKGRQEEARQAAAPKEIFKTAKSSATRVVAPNDLDAIDPSGSGRTPKAGTLGQVTIRNRGNSTYHNVMLKVSYLDGAGNVLDTKNRLVLDTIEPGQDFAVGEISAENAPKGTSRCSVSILYSELGPAPLKAG